MIILEGPDRTGKTTLAQSISDSRWYTYSHEGPPATKDLLQYYAGRILASHYETVFDRLFIGETIYGPVKRGTDLLEGKAGIKLMNRLVVSFGIRVVICLPRYEVCHAAWKANIADEYLKTEEEFEAVYDRYQQFALDMMTDPTVSKWYQVYDFEKDSGVVLRDKPGRPYWNYIGSRTPKVIFVGEVANHETLDLAFFSLSNSSRFLNDCIEEAGWGEDEIGFVNAISLEGRSISAKQLRKEYGHPLLVTLGNAADEVVRRECRAVESLPHPSFWKRFHSKERNVYVERLKGIRALLR